MIRNAEVHPLLSADVGDRTTPGTATPPRPELDLRLLMRAQEMVHVGTWVAEVNPATSRFEEKVFWSNEMFRILGLEPSSGNVTFATFIEAVHSDDRDRVLALIDSATKAAMPFRFDFRVATADGKLKVLHSRATFEFDERGAIIRVLGTCSDVTERVRAERALAESELRLRAVFEQSAVGMAVANLAGTLQHVNRAFAEFLGYAETELEGKTFLEITHPSDIAETIEHTFKLDAARSSTYEKRYIRRDGTFAWGKVTVSRLRIPGKPDGFMAVIEDIDEHRHASRELERQTEILRGMLDHLPVMVVRLNASGTLAYSNRESQRVFGWSAKGAGSDIVSAAFPEREQRERVKAMLLGGRPQWTDLEPRAADGRVVPSTWAAINLSDGQSLIIGQDLTERRQMQEELAQAQKLEAIGQLAGGIAHDFNNLLTVISAGAAFVQDAANGNTGISSDAQDILNACNRAASLTRQLLAFSRRQMLQPEVLNVNDVIQGLSKTLRRLLTEQIELEVLCEAEQPSVEVDRHQLEQVILNLAVNSRDAIKENGTITVLTRNGKDVLGKDELMLQVSDDGVGIEPAILHRIFEPFFTTKSIGKGTGLGLATVHGIVEQSGGRVAVESKPGTGTTFTVHLRCVDAVPLPSRVSGDQALSGGTETILLVEDESTVRAITRRMLMSMGYTVIEARHGRDGLDLARNPSMKIDLLVTDVIMPEMGGRELANALRALQPTLPVLYVSGYTDDELLRRGVLEPGVRLLRKPFEKRDLGVAVQALLHEVARVQSKVA